MKPRLYFDTSVFGGIYDKEFQIDTTQLFRMVLSGKIICVYSDLSELELENAPDKVKKHFLSLPQEFMQFVEITEEINWLAEEYIREKVVGETSIDDCRHIAAATVNRIDNLISWNFKHIVNVFRIRGYNTINIKNGYPPLYICSPKEFIANESGKRF